MAVEWCWMCHQNHLNNQCKLLFGKQLLLCIFLNQSQSYQSEQQQHPRKVSLRCSAGYKTPSAPPFKLQTQTHKQGHNILLNKMCISPWRDNRPLGLQDLIQVFFRLWHHTFIWPSHQLKGTSLIFQLGTRLTHASLLSHHPHLLGPLLHLSYANRTGGGGSMGSR